jgi:cell division transport system permease protein
MKKHRFFNMYLTTTVSVAMVLFLIGLECVVLMGAHSLMTRVKENLTLTVVMTSDADAGSVSRMKSILEVVPFCQSYRFISRQEALEEHIRTLGEDPTRFLGFNPLTDAYEVRLKADYACADSIAIIHSQFQDLPYVDKVVYQEDIVRALDRHIGEVSVILLGVALVLLMVAWVLIVNTVRLQVYSKRFLINTMRLVGATRWVICKPFIRRSMVMGLEAGLLTTVVLVFALWYGRSRLGIVLFPFAWPEIACLAAVVMLSGIVITGLASFIATGRYVHMKIDRMYEI